MVGREAKKPFVCDLCGKMFFHCSKPLEHQQVVHRDQEASESQQTKPLAVLKSFSCTVCQKGFSSTDSLRVHEQTHSEENKFICSTCGKCFHRKCTFVCHMRRHSVEKLNSCSVCGKRFLHSCGHGFLKPTL
ncbi:Zinc finger protein 549 [Channa argus]|uniref:Zinc finger protein 549 n=1 Tax=Channa argus TaxID=215402 RepID=A0A6G1PSW5_CHAAH|nr:Zinc finger protein 549 [Channa argus]